ncbi:MAG: hypothetical protein HQ512_00320 [Rhodospirillales bacterium]|nr:hypothetical protein [Rhodospirillales bacterium]
MTDDYSLPSPPNISEEDLRSCRKTGDYCPILFEWYKFVGLLCNFIASIQLESPALRSTHPQHYYVLIGLLNRCSRLMFSNVALSHEGLFGETTAIVDRCIFENCINILWLCESGSDDKFTRFLATGLKTELEFKAKIQTNINKNDSEPLPIETRMLRSISNHITASGLTENEIASTKKLPNLALMIESLGYDRLTYIVGQKLGSHHIHGTWPSLLHHYLEEDSEGGFRPRDHDCETHINQYAFVPLTLLEAMEAFSRYILEDSDDLKPFSGLYTSTKDEIMKIYTKAVEHDEG